MRPKRWQQIKEVYQSVLERDPDQQEAFLKTACAGDESLLKEVKSLLAHRADAEEFLESPALAAIEPAVDREGKPEIDLVGRPLSHYRILRKIGEGGMGVVFLARDEHLQRDVAIKVLPAGTLADESARKRIRKEALALSKLNHPNIETVHDFNTSDGMDFLVMEYVSGPTLKDKVARGPLPEKEVIALGIQMAAALEEAHEKGVIHRDLKPANIILTPKGQLKILDFGLARLLRPTRETSSTESFSATAPMAGTLPYMAPEQLRGETVGPRSDLFSFGAVLYEMATGHRAFGGSTPAMVCDAILNKTPTAPARLNPEVSAELERIIHKALEKDPENRFQHAKDMLVDLRRHASRTTPLDIEGPRPERSGKARRLAWAIVTGSALVILLSLCWVLLHTSQPLPQFKNVPVTTTAGWEGEPEVAPDGKLLVYTSNASGNNQIYLTDSHGIQTKTLTDDKANNSSPTWFPDQREIAFVSERDGTRDIWKVSVSGGAAVPLVPNAQGPAVSPDGRYIAFARPSASRYHRIGVASLSNPGDVTILTSDRDGLWNHDDPTWSPDSKEICYRSWHGIWVVSLTGGPARRLTSGYELDFDPVWSHSGRNIYFASYRGGSPAIWRVSPQGGEPEQVTMGSGAESHPSLPWDGKRLFYTTSAIVQQIVLLDRRSGEKAIVSDSESDYMASIAPDGSRIVYASERGGSGNLNLWVQNLDKGRVSGPPRKLTYYNDTASHPALSPDNRWVACYRIIRGQRDIWIVSNPAGESFQFTDNPAVDMHPAWSPDGSQLAFVSERSGWRDIWIASVNNGKPSGSPPRELATHPVSALAPAWSPDGGMIAFTGETDDRAEVWLIPSKGGSPAKRITSGAGIKRVRWDPSTGDLLASATWGANRVYLWRVSPQSGAGKLFFPPIEFGGKEAPGLFDLSRDGQLLLFTRTAGAKGHIRAQDATNGTY